MSTSTDSPGAVPAPTPGLLEPAGQREVEETLNNPFQSKGLTTGGVEGRRWWQSHTELLISALAVLVAIGVWQLSALFLKPIFLSTPEVVAPSLYNLIASGQLPGAFLRSLIEMILGLAVAGVVGIGVGLLMGRIRLLERALEPLVAFGNATPSIALLPLMEVWFGFGTTARVAFIMVIAVWPLLVNTHLGVRAVRGRLADVGKTFGMSGWQQIRYIYLPGTMPFIFVGARISLAVGAVGMIPTILTTTALAFLLFWGLRQLQARGFPWIAATSAGRKA
jgi:ABC-type nitrate/sulfonate/bicarbonate transport system permease component